MEPAEEGKPLKNQPLCNMEPNKTVHSTVREAPKWWLKGEQIGALFGIVSVFGAGGLRKKAQASSF